MVTSILYGSKRGSIANYINTSCYEKNCNCSGLVVIYDNLPHLLIYAKRNIKKNEWLLWDYNEGCRKSSFNGVCLCGTVFRTQGCKGKIGGLENPSSLNPSTSNPSSSNQFPWLHNFLNKIDKIDYFPSFIENGFENEKSLQYLEFEDFKVLNIKKLGHQRLIYNKLKDELKIISNNSKNMRKRKLNLNNDDNDNDDNDNDDNSNKRRKLNESSFTSNTQNRNRHQRTHKDNDTMNVPQIASKQDSSSRYYALHLLAQLACEDTGELPSQ